MWSEFNAVRCIHMPKRKDRREVVERAIQTLQIPISFYYAKAHVNGGVEGCFDSHKRVLSEHSNLDNCLVFEDDFEISPTFSVEMLQEAIRFMNVNKDWDIIYLGCFPDIWRYPQKNLFGHIYEVKASCTHSYIASKRFMQQFKNVNYDMIPIDEVFKSYKTYAIVPGLFRQTLSKTDVSDMQFVSTLAVKHYITAAVEQYVTLFGHVPLRQICLFFCVVLFFFLAQTVKYKNGCCIKK